jgi:hypothetical protein
MSVDRRQKIILLWHQKQLADVAIMNIEVFDEISDSFLKVERALVIIGSINIQLAQNDAIE